MKRAHRILNPGLIMMVLALVLLSGCELRSQPAQPGSIAAQATTTPGDADAPTATTQDSNVDATATSIDTDADPTPTSGAVESPTAQPTAAPGDATQPTATATPMTQPQPTATPITAEPAPTNTPVPAPGTEREHVVKAGENLFRIALQYNKTYQEVAQYNGIVNPNLIYPGQTIRIPGDMPGGGAGHHIVAPGETLMMIAIRYNTSVQTLAAANNIANPNFIYVGQKLIIP